MSRKMTSRERVLTAIAHQEPDRVPINYFANSGIHNRLKEHFGLSEEDDEGLRRALGVDFRGIAPPYVGPALHQQIEGIRVDEWGIHRRWVEHPSGGYWDYCAFPLRDAGIDEVDAWPMPSPDDYDYESVRQQAAEMEDFCVYVGNSGLGDIINKGGMLRTMEQVLVDLISDDPAGLRLVERRHEICLEVTRRTIEAAGGRADLLWIGEDLGTQKGPTISPELYRRHIRPRHQELVDLAKSYDLPVMIHSCGSSSWAFEDFIEIGIDVVDTLQPEAKDMAPAYLKKTYGDRLAFHGCISTAGPVAYGTKEEVISNVREVLEIMMPGGGYCMAPSHSLQDNSPTENVVAMYETAQACGYYS